MLSRNLRLVFTASAVLAIVATVSADPPVNNPGPDPIPPVFCFRVMDIERVVTGDATPGNDFAVDFELVNWTNMPADGLTFALNAGTSTIVGTAPNILGLGVDRDGRGGALGGADMSATGAGLTTGSGVFDFPAVQSGRGRGDVGGLLNDWTPTGLGVAPLGSFAGLGTLARWDGSGGTVIPNEDLLGAAAVAGGLLPADLIPGQGTDALGDTAIDGGPGPYVPAGPGSGPGDFAGGAGNSLDGFTLTIQDWDIDEVLSFNWFLTAGGANIGVSGQGNAFGFGVTNLVRITPGAALPGGVLFDLGLGNGNGSNTGFTQNTTDFFDTVYQVPNPAEFAVEFGASITAPFANSSDNLFNAPLNVTPEPGTLVLLALGGLMLARRRRQTR